MTRGEFYKIFWQEGELYSRRIFSTLLQKLQSGFIMGNQTIYFKKEPRIIATSTIAGPKECEGVIGRYVETALADDMFGESTYEKAECKMLSHVIDGAITNAGLKRDEIDMIVSGDLLNPPIFTLRTPTSY